MNNNLGLAGLSDVQHASVHERMSVVLCRPRRNRVVTSSMHGYLYTLYNTLNNV